MTRTKIFLGLASLMLMAGLNLEQDMLEAQAEMAKAEADLLAARLNYKITFSELKILIGEY
jgi:outer membrane protein TolC